MLEPEMPVFVVEHAPTHHPGYPQDPASTPGEPAQHANAPHMPSMGVGVVAGRVLCQQMAEEVVAHLACRKTDRTPRLRWRGGA